MTADTPTPLVGLLPEEMYRLPLLSDQPLYRVRQIASWIYRRSVTDFDRMTDLPATLRRSLASRYSLARLPVASTRRSQDGSTRKYLFALHDGCEIEAVQMREPRRDTICVSTQSGCAFGCRFCATGSMGLDRNLSAHEILAQVLVIRDALLGEGSEGHFNLVFMGMGEPLANYPAVLRAIRVLGDDFGLGIGRRRITLSTVGLVPQIRRLSREPWAPRLALSLNATRDEVRSQLMPVNARYPIAAALAALAEYGARTGCRTTLEYVLLRGWNDSDEDACQLADYARQCGCTVNLIAFNAHPATDLEGSPPERVQAFRELMLPLSPTVTVRESKGQDILAACGQLATKRSTRQS